MSNSNFTTSSSAVFTSSALRHRQFRQCLRFYSQVGAQRWTHKWRPLLASTIQKMSPSENSFVVKVRCNLPLKGGHQLIVVGSSRLMLELIQSVD